jgi:hypothetical protein
MAIIGIGEAILAALKYCNSKFAKMNCVEQVFAVHDVRSVLFIY